MKISSALTKSIIVIFICIVIFLISDTAEFYIWQYKIRNSPHEGYTGKKLLPPHPFVSFRKIKTFDEEYKETDTKGYLSDKNYLIDSPETTFRRPITEINNKILKGKPIVIFGCSYSWGYNLKENSTFGYKLAELTGSPIYNRSLPRWGVQQMLYQTKREDFYQKIPEPKYAVYVFIGSHLGRMLKYSFCYPYYDFAYLKYDKKDNMLTREKLNFNRIYFQSEWDLRSLYTRHLYKDEDYIFDMFKLHVLEAKNELQKHWKNTKFVMIMYEDTDPWFSSHAWIFDSPRLKELQDEGIIIIKTDDLTNEIKKHPDKYFISKKDHHPSAKAWELLTPLIFERLKKGN